MLTSMTPRRAELQTPQRFPGGRRNTDTRGESEMRLDDDHACPGETSDSGGQLDQTGRRRGSSRSAASTAPRALRKKLATERDRAAVD